MKFTLVQINTYIQRLMTISSFEIKHAHFPSAVNIMSNFYMNIASTYFICNTKWSVFTFLFFFSEVYEIDSFTVCSQIRYRIFKIPLWVWPYFPYQLHHQKANVWSYSLRLVTFLHGSFIGVFRMSISFLLCARFLWMTSQALTHMINL